MPGAFLSLLCMHCSFASFFKLDQQSSILGLGHLYMNVFSTSLALPARLIADLYSRWCDSYCISTLESRLSRTVYVRVSQIMRVLQFGV